MITPALRVPSSAMNFPTHARPPLVVAGLLLSLTACGSGAEPAPGQAPTPAVPATSAATTPAAEPTLGLPARIDTDGWYHAGPYSASDVTAVEPGTYDTGGPVSGSSCVITLAGADGKPAEGSGFVTGPMTIEMVRGSMLSTTGCMPWERQASTR